MRRALTLGAALVALLLTPTGAEAWWSAGPGSGAGTATTSTLDAPTISAPATSSGTNTISWVTQAAVHDATGASPVTYVVQRKLGAGAFAAVPSGPCSGTLTKPVTSCADTVTVNGTYSYQVVATYSSSWTATSNTVSVAATPDPAPVVSAIDRLDASPSAASTVRWKVTFSESVTGVTAGDFSPVRTGGITGTPAVTAVSGAGTTWTVTASTGGGSGTLGLNLVDDDSIKDSSGQALGGTGAGNGNFTGQVYAMDRTAPQLQSLEMLDTDQDGKVDQVKATFDETLASYSAGTLPWTLTNVPSLGTLSSVSVSGTVATLTLSEGVGAESTAVGSFKVALAANAAGIRDALGNKSSFAAQAPDDQASPVFLLSGSAENSGATDGKIEPGDSLTLGFSEPILAGSVPATTTITESRAGAGNVQLAIPSFFAGAFDLGRTDYLTGTGSAVFAGTLTVSGATVKVTVGACSSGCALPRAPAAAGTSTYAPASTITDAAGNPAVGSATLAVKVF